MPRLNKTYQQQIVVKDVADFNHIYLVPLADWHIGDKNAAVDVIQGYIDWIRERDNAFTILNGDLLNCATKDSSAELYDDLVTPDTAYEKVREMCLPIKDKILMLTRGNHEEAIFKKVGADYMARLAYDLGELPFKPDGGMIGLRVATGGKRRLTAMCYAYAVHGWGGARTIGAKVKKAQDLVMVADADIYILSHDHTQNCNRGNLLTPSRRKQPPFFLQTRRKLFVNTGGFIRYSGYIQRKGLTPQDLGTPRIRIEFKDSYAEGYHIDLHASI